MKLPTRVAKAGWDEHRFQGHAVFGELLGSLSLTQLIALSLGVELDADEGRMLDDMIVSCTFGDPHIWPLKLSRVSAAHGNSSLTGLAAGLLASEGPVTGVGPVTPMAELLARSLTLGHERAIAEIRAALTTRRRLPGFGVPGRRVDERVVALTGRVITHQREQLPFWVMWQQLADEARRFGVEANIASAFTAAALDLGFPIHRVEALFAMALLPCFLANAVEGAEQQPEILQELPYEVLDYQGPPRRRSPRARAEGR